MFNFFKKVFLAVLFVCLALGWFGNSAKAVNKGQKNNILGGVGTVSSLTYGEDISQIDAEAAFNSKLAGFIKSALSFVGVVLLVVIIYAGYLWMTAGGNTEQVKKAHSWIINGAIGLVLVSAAYYLTDFALEIVLSS